MIRFCGRRVLCHQDFRFYLSTPLPKPRFNPEIASTTTMINYGVSHDTLTEDLLTRAFSRIRPELYKEKRIALRNMQLQKDTLLRLSDIVKEKVLTNQEAMLGSAKALTFITDITNAKIEVNMNLNCIAKYFLLQYSSYRQDECNKRNDFNIIKWQSAKLSIK